MVKKQSKNAVRQRRHERIRAKITGSAECPRLSVYRSNAHIHVQLIDDRNGITLVSASSVQLKLANGNIESAAKVGKDIALKALAQGITSVVFDRSGYIYHGRVKAIAEAAREAGLKF